MTSTFPTRSAILSVYRQLLRSSNIKIDSKQARKNTLATPWARTVGKYVTISLNSSSTRHLHARNANQSVSLRTSVGALNVSSTAFERTIEQCETGNGYDCTSLHLYLTCVVCPTTYLMSSLVYPPKFSSPSLVSTVSTGIARIPRRHGLCTTSQWTTSP